MLLGLLLLIPLYWFEEDSGTPSECWPWGFMRAGGGGTEEMSDEERDCCGFGCLGSCGDKCFRGTRISVEGEAGSPTGGGGSIDCMAFWFR